MPDRSRLDHLGFGAWAHVPVLFDESQRLLREHTRYLRDRAAGYWSPRSTFHHSTRHRVPSPRTVRQAAESLAVFVDWCDRKHRTWRDLSYDDVLKFQNDMSRGKDTASGRCLSPVTVNLRADEATAFLEWAWRHNLRGPFTVPREPSERRFSVGTSPFGQVSVRETRIGRAKQSRTGSIAAISLLPTPKEVVEWLRQVKSTKGTSKHLAAKFVLQTGARRDETVNVTVDMIPSREVLDAIAARGRSVAYIKLTKTKGSVPREIPLSLPFLWELRTWIETKRLTMQMRWERRTGRQPSNLLFVSDCRGHEGTPLTAATLYKVFTSVKPRPIKWHPHFGRHTFACFYVLHALRNEAASAGHHLGKMGVDWINAQGAMHLKMLQRQLGHLDEKTTEIYLQWLATASGLEGISASWHDFLASEAT